jgi:hypothetical protein
MIKIKNDEIIEDTVGDVINFPKYLTQLINLANQNAQGTIPRVVGQMVEGLVLTKTYTGLRFQKSILKRIASIKRTSYRLANPEEESKGIDGFIGNIPISIKPITYNTKDMLPESIQAKIIYYEKKKDGITISYDF